MPPPSPTQYGFHIGRAGFFSNEPRDFRIVLMGLFCSPSVEIQIDGPQFPGTVHDKDRPGVTNPQIVQRRLNELHALAAQLSRDHTIFGPDQHRHRLELQNSLGEQCQVGSNIG